jgi:hypothetical protein
MQTNAIPVKQAIIILIIRYLIEPLSHPFFDLLIRHVERLILTLYPEKQTNTNIFTLNLNNK